MKVTKLYLLTACIAILSWSWPQILLAQENLVLNPSFEEYEDCNYQPSNMIIQDVVPHWYFRTHTSPRLLHFDCLDSTTTATEPRFGKGYAASLVDALATDSTGFYSREYLQARLKSALLPSKDYYFSYHVTLPFPADVAISHLGIHFTYEWWEGPIDFLGDGNSYSIFLDPILEFDTIPEVSYGKWTQIDYCFQVDSAYDVILIGNFASQEELIGSENQVSSHTFYGYDNFFLAEIEDSIELVEYQDTICAGECIHLSTNHSLIPGTFEWSLPGGSPSSSTDSSVTVCYSEAGIYDIAVHITHCTGEYQQTWPQAITVGQGIDHSLPQDTQICTGDQITIELPSSLQILWYDGSTSANRVFSQEGIYSYTLDNGVCRDTFQFEISYFRDPMDELIEIGSCVGQEVSFLGQSYAVPGLYRDTLRDMAGCDSIRYEINYQHFPLPTRPTWADTGYCENQELLLYPPPHIQDILWWDNSTESPRRIDAAGIYTFSFTDIYGCDYLDTVSVESFPSPIVQTSDLLDIWYEPGLLLPVQYSDDVIQYSWDDLGGLSCDLCPFPELIAPISGEYRIRVANEYDCIDQNSVLVRFLEVNVYIPNVLSTLSSSTQNQSLFVLSNVDLTYDLSVYSRWGNLVFRTENASANIPEHGWIPSPELNPGVYVYHLSYEVNGEKKTVSGDVTVVR